MSELVKKIVAKLTEDSAALQALRERHAAELKEIEDLQEKRLGALLERAGMTEFSFLTDLFITLRDEKARKKKEEEEIEAKKGRIESWLLKMLRDVGEGVKTAQGTVYLSRKESVTVSDFDTFVDTCMLRDAAKTLVETFELQAVYTIDDVVRLIHENLHLEYLNKAVNKTAILELMGEQDSKTGSRPNPPPAGLNYASLMCVGVRKPTGRK